MHEKQMLTYQDGQIDTSSFQKLQTDREEVSALGEIACGDPIQEEEHLLYRTSLPTAVFGKGPFYILYAKGDSMEDAGIEEGDILVIRKNADPKLGDIIVALDEYQENTLKRYGGIANSRFLRTAGPHFPDSPGHIKRTAWDIGRARGAPPC